MYSSNSRRFTSFFVPTKRTKGQLGAFSILSILLMPMLLYSAASLVVSAIFRWMGTVGVLVMRVLLSWRLCRQIEPVFFAFEGNRIALPELRCGRRWYCWPFGALFVYAGPAFPGGFRLLFAVDFGRAVPAVFRPAEVGEEAPAADLAAAKFLRAENGLFQLWLSRQHGAAKPPTKQAAGDVLRTNAVQQQAVAIQEVAAAFCKTAHAACLPRRQAEKRSVRQALDGVKSGHRYPPLQSASRPPDCRW